VAIVKPFRALRPHPEAAKQVSCVPYDVADDEEAREHVRANPLSFLHVTRPEAEFEPPRPAAETILEHGRENLRRFIEEGVLVLEDEPSIYIYRLSTDTHSQTGVVGCCSLEEYDKGLIVKHERTRPDKVEDRMHHMLQLRAQTGLIFLAYRETDAIEALVAAECEYDPLLEFECLMGVRHTVWKARSGEAISEAFRAVPALYIADGHHRAESASLARRHLEREDPAGPDADYNFLMAGIFPAKDLKIRAYNRVVRSLNGMSEPEFLAKLENDFTVTDASSATPTRHGELALYLAGKWHSLLLHDKKTAEDAVERLDVSILQHHILDPILGIEDATRDERIGFVGGAKGSEALEELVDSGEFKAAFSLFPTTIEDLFEVSDAGAVMPPKSTWFEPKLKDGLFVHLI
jgi:uncharacterized protein (DUF1015 family)